MFKFDRHDVQRMTVSALGAAALSATCILAVAGPARAEAPLTNAAWQRAVEHQLDDRGGTPFVETTGQVPATDLALRFDAAGKLADVRIERSSGDAATDAGAVDLVRSMTFPATAGARTVGMHILHNASPRQLAAARARAARTVTYARADDRAPFRIAAK